MRKILVTGGAGFIGSCLAEKLIEDKNNFVVIVDNLLTGDLSKLPQNGDNWKFIKCDVNDYQDISPVMLSFQFDFVFHYAALVGVARTLANPARVLNDIEGIKHVLNLAKNTGVQRIYFSSSSEVYGEPVEYPQNEDTTPLNSKLPYAIVKNVGEAFLKSYKKEYGLEYTIFRFFNTYGPKQSHDFVMSRFLVQANKGHDLTIYGDGSQTRTFCYIDDNIEATVNAFNQDKYVNDVVNIGNDLETPIFELAKLVKEVTKSSSEIVNGPALKEGDMTRRKPDIGKMKQLLSNDLVSIKDGIAKLIDSGKFN